MVAALTACAHGAARRAGDDRLVAVNFEGNAQLGDQTLLTGLAQHRVLERHGAADAYLVQVDAERIRGEYLRRGYIDVDVRSRVERKGDDATVIYTIEEGPRAATRTVIRGLPDDVPRDQVRAQLPLEDGQPFDYEAYETAKPRLLGVVEDAGYAHARLDARVVADRAARTAIVELAYTAGPRSKFGKVVVTGVTGELAQAARDRLEFAPADVYSAKALVQTQRNLYGFGRFSTVQITPDRSTGAVVGVEVALAESARHEVTLGGGLGMDPLNYEIRGRAGYSLAGWPFPLDTVSIDFRPAYAVAHDFATYEPRFRVLGKLERQDLLWTYAKGTVEAGYNYLAVEAYTSYGPLARLGLETRLGTERVRLRVGWGLEQVAFRDVNRLVLDHPEIVAALGVTHDQRIGGYQQTLIIDLRDNPIEPTLGAYAELRTTEGTKYAGGSYEYLSVVPDVRAYVPLGFGAVLAGHLKYGAIHGDVPATERYFAGGANSQRGFSERELSPSITGPNTARNNEVETIPFGGVAMIDSSVEARVPITTVKSMPLGTAVFLDGGAVTESIEALHPWNLYWAIGAGLRLQTIVGPVRFDVGYRLNRVGDAARDPAPGSHWAYHLTIGEAF